MLALTFATLFRNALAGFAVAALYWCMDIPPGPPANAFLSIRSYATFLSSKGFDLDALVSPWWVSKASLLGGALLLYSIHSRLVFGLGVAPTVKAKRRTLGWAAGLIGLYIVSGATSKVIYGYSQRGTLMPSDAAWFRQQFYPYGPIPVSYVFGPAFRRYLGDTNGWRPSSDEGDRLGDTMKHHRELREVVEKMPDSIWAPSAADLLGRLSSRQGATIEDRVSMFQQVADKYPNSPYVDVAYRERARIFDGVERQNDARREYEELLKRNPQSVYRLEALRYIVENERANQNPSGMIQWARKWAEVAPVQERFSAYLAIMEGLKAQHDIAGAREAAQQTADAVKKYKQAVLNNELSVSESIRLKAERQADAANEAARAMLQSAQ
jgi:tetratricopeptide (TPR) repeat protein